MARVFRGGWRLAGPYLLVVFAVSAYVGCRIAVDPHGFTSAWIYFFVLAFPWSGVAANAWWLYKLANIVREET